MFSMKVHDADMIALWAAIPSRGLIRLIYFDQTVNSEWYLRMVCNSFVP
jgi:hypothetical protein